jgi:hypothetical protein
MSILTLDRDTHPVRAHSMGKRISQKRRLCLVLYFRLGPIEWQSAQKSLAHDRVNITADHICVLVQDHDTTLFLAGDASYNENLMLAGKVDGVSPCERVSGGTLNAGRGDRDNVSGFGQRPAACERTKRLRRKIKRRRIEP